MTKIYESGSKYSLFSDEDLIIHDELPANTYRVGFSEIRNDYFLEKIDDFKITHKLYGDIEYRANKILDTFSDRTKNTGVLLSGEKGCGKTLLAKKVSELGASRGMPTIIINNCFVGDDFNKFLSLLDKKMIVIFDEFEKIYNDEAQKKLLTILDGTYSSKKLFIMTCNSLYKIDNHFLNRPGRIFYSFKYTGLENNFIKEYCKDKLKNLSVLPDILSLSESVKNMNFDMLQGIVEESNRYNENIKDIVSNLNIELEQNTSEYKVHLSKNGIPVKTDDSILRYHNPFGSSFRIYLETDETENVGIDNTAPAVAKSSDEESIEFSAENITKIYNNQKMIEYEKDDYVLLLTKIEKFNFFDKLF